MLVGRVAFGLAALAVLAAGCARYRPEPLSPAANAAALEKRTLADPRLRRFIAAGRRQDGASPADPGWDLTALTLAAVYFHPDLDVARARLAGARAAVITARQHPNPLLDFRAIFDSAAVPGAITPGAPPLTIGPVINLIVETFGKREYRSAKARRLAEAARWDLATAGWQVRRRVRAALLGLWAARQRIALTRRRLELRRQLVGLLTRRLAVGAADALEVTRERIDRDKTAMALRDSEAAAAATTSELAAAIGIPAAALDGVRLSFGAFERGDPLHSRLDESELRRRALTGRTDIEAALARYQSTQSALQLAIAGQYPDLTLGPGYEYDAGVNKFGISPAAKLPIFNQHQGQIAEAVASRRQAAVKFTALQAQIITAIDAAVAAYHAARRAFATSDALLRAAARRDGQVAASFRIGQVDRPTLVTAEIETATVRLAQFGALAGELQAVGALEDAVQQPLFEPTTAFSVPPINPRRSPGQSS
ncbi:MAG TPA: TolC family protein [Stellaceae bacterium]|nr:TolC family protein [Stellaceae bacterium]